MPIKRLVRKKQPGMNSTERKQVALRQIQVKHLKAAEREFKKAVIATQKAQRSLMASKG
jgi:hypothetical protein